ncbi:DUF1801 domain-containing protein [uncultured Tateyamaria sp.]|uniref:DUF1801 domain-containing protein n=1 Tax=uncultured Tateyamaria sp. TaxID=455651 RepID=UPI00261B0FA7|nr:DUF1801 domain-containing protein [uncultured Tateyamaria sp.]
MAAKTIDAFHAALAPEDREMCDVLRTAINTALPDALGKIWHAHPVWFLEDNPIVGYSRLKDCVRLMFWSGQSFETPGLTKSGTFKAGELRIQRLADVKAAPLEDWLAEARTIQWDYKNIVKNKGRLDRLV